MVGILNECELMICPASGTSMEAAAVGIGMVSGTTANNQLGILGGLVKKKCVINAGDLNSISAEEISALIEKCIKEPRLINDMIGVQKKMIDGLSPERINRAFKQLINAN
ncbi:MAG: hypothetical protein IPJ60_04055 [Sphingobacteriaceae bacterium]|nr:hypothetical protein [Sphingobacteriaceae bacterium]